MPTKANKLLENFKETVRLREITRNKMEIIFTDRSINESDILIIYNGLFLSLFTDFEKVLEDLFWGLIKGSIYIESLRNSPNPIRKVKISPQREIESIVLSGKNYLDWLPYDNTIKRANIFFNNGLPFTKLTSDEKNNLKSYHTIRNAIAHKSPKAESDFKRLIMNSRLLPSQRTPAGYLRSKPTGNETQYEIAAGELIRIANDLCL